MEKYFRKHLRLSFLFAVAFLFALGIMPKTALAEGDLVHVSVSTATPTSGGYAYVVIALETNQPGIHAVGFDLVYDNTRLELVSITRGDIGTQFTQPFLPLSLMFDGMPILQNVYGTGELATVRFRVLATASSGVVQVSLTAWPDAHRFDGFMPVTFNPMITPGGVYLEVSENLPAEPTLPEPTPPDTTAPPTDTTIPSDTNAQQADGETQPDTGIPPTVAEIYPDVPPMVDYGNNEPPQEADLSPVYAPPNILRFVIGSETYTHNGLPYTIEAAPFVESGRTLVPLRFIAQAMGADVDWIRATRTVLIYKEGTHLQLTIDVPLPDDMGMPLIVAGRTFVPLRYVSEMLGATVRWDSTARAVYIYF